MTGLEPHPIFTLPTLEWAEANGGKPAVESYIHERASLMQMEHDNPLSYGFEPEIWNVVDDLLIDGNTVVLDLTRIARLMPDGKAPCIPDIPKEIKGASEVWIGGSQRSSKSEYAGKKCMKVLRGRNEARGWSFADTGPISIARQQPIFWRYMPPEVKRMARETGKARQGAILNVSWKQKTGFAEQSFVLPNASQHWFKNYEQDIENVEGDQLDVLWLDELRNPMLLKTLRYRMGDRGGIVIVTFTSIDDNYSAIVQEYDRGSRLVLEVEGELLPIKKPKDLSAAPEVSGARSAEPEVTGARAGADAQDSAKAPGRAASPMMPAPGGAKEELVTVGYEKVPRIKVAGPGSDGDQKANIVYFHITDNPYYGFTADLKPGQKMLTGRERFYKLIKGATREKILARAYGILTRSSLQRFPRFHDLVHVIDPERIPAHGTNYQIVDPCDGRNWAMVWVRIDALGRWYVYREWPSTGHPGAYIPGVGDPGPWALPGEPADGIRGRAQSPFGFGLDRYYREILRLEGNREEDSGESAVNEPAPPHTENLWWRRAIRNPLTGQKKEQTAAPVAEDVSERWMDSRYGNSPTQTKEGSTTLIEQMAELGMLFSAASGKDIEDGTTLVNDLLDYDPETDLGQYSPALARMNAPKLFISRDCPNVIYALREWTGKDKQHGACKDFVDVLRYAALARLDYMGPDAYAWQGGGTY